MPNIVEYSANNSGGVFWLQTEDWLALERAGWIVIWRRGSEQPSPWGSPLEDGTYGYFWEGQEHKKDENGVPIPYYSGPDPEDTYLGTTATEAFRVGLPLREAIAEFEFLTGNDSKAEGCPCCGPPHYFYQRSEE